MGLPPVLKNVSTGGTKDGIPNATIAGLNKLINEMNAGLRLSMADAVVRIGAILSENTIYNSPDFRAICYILGRVVDEQGVKNNHA